MVENQPSPRRRFQFRLRTLFVIVTIVAVQCAVCLPMLKKWQRHEQMRRIVEALNLSISSSQALPP
jgi:Tfp pilus assembly protein FimT